MSKITAVANQKGGVGKTFISSNIASYFTAKAKKVLMVELDPQGNLTLAFFEKDDTPTPIESGYSHTLSLFDEEFRGEPVEINENLFLFGATKSLSKINNNDESIAKVFAENIAKIASDYDHVIIDCPPSIGNLQISALLAADYLIIPSEAAEASAIGVGEIMTTARHIKNIGNSKLKVLGVVLNKLTRPASNVQKMFVDQILDSVGSLSFDSQLFSTVKVNESVTMKEPLFEYAPKYSEKIGLTSFLKELEIKVEG
jgi:chromosome partitioning protein